MCVCLTACYCKAMYIIDADFVGMSGLVVSSSKYMCGVCLSVFYYKAIYIIGEDFVGTSALTNQNVQEVKK